MWQQFKVNHDTGEATPIADPKSATSDLAGAQAAENIFTFWAGDWPDDEQEQHEIAEETVRANGGRVLRVILGLPRFQIKPNPTGGACGRCYCVVDGNSRRCKTFYWRDGHAVEVDCGRSC